MIGGIRLGTAKVVIGDAPDGNHSVEQLADMFMDRLINISGEAPKPVRDQIMAFQVQVRALTVQYLNKMAEIEAGRWRMHQAREFHRILGDQSQGIGFTFTTPDLKAFSQD